MRSTAAAMSRTSSSVFEMREKPLDHIFVRELAIDSIDHEIVRVRICRRYEREAVLGQVRDAAQPSRSLVAVHECM